MKKIIPLTAALLLIVVVNLSAQTRCEKAVAKSAESLRLAMISGNKNDLDNIVLDDLSYGHSGGLVETKSAFIDKFATGKSDFVTINIKEQTIDVNKKTAIVRQVLSADTNDNNKPATVNLKVMLVFVKVKGDWKLLARQAVKLA